MKRQLLAVSIFALLSTSAFASSHKGYSESPFSYDNISVGYVTTDFDELSDDFTGLNAKLVKSLGESNFYGTLSYTQVSLDEHDIAQGDYGIGYKHSVTDRFDLNAELAVVKIDKSYEDNGYRFGLVGRYMVSPHVEIYGGVDLYEFDDMDRNKVSVKAGGKYNIDRNIDVYAEILATEDYNTYLIGASYRW